MKEHQKKRYGKPEDSWTLNQEDCFPAMNGWCSNLMWEDGGRELRRESMVGNWGWPGLDWAKVNQCSGGT